LNVFTKRTLGKYLSLFNEFAFRRGEYAIQGYSTFRTGLLLTPTNGHQINIQVRTSMFRTTNRNYSLYWILVEPLDFSEPATLHGIAHVIGRSTIT